MAELTAVEKNSLLARIGNTPLVELQSIFRSDKIRILAKLEWFNPGGSVKDRPAYNFLSEEWRTPNVTPTGADTEVQRGTSTDTNWRNVQARRDSD